MSAELDFLLDIPIPETMRPYMLANPFSIDEFGEETGHMAFLNDPELHFALPVTLLDRDFGGNYYTYENGTSPLILTLRSSPAVKRVDFSVSLVFMARYRTKSGAQPVMLSAARLYKTPLQHFTAMYSMRYRKLPNVWKRIWNILDDLDWRVP